MKLLEIYYARNPLGLRSVFRRAQAPTALQLAASDLEACRADRLEHAREAEYHAAMTTMLEEREKRLQQDIARLMAVTAEMQQT